VEIGAGTEEAGVFVAILAGALAKEVDNFRFRHLARNLEVTIQAVLGRNGSE
jgi:hypothetical protein